MGIGREWERRGSLVVSRRVQYGLGSIKVIKCLRRDTRVYRTVRGTGTVYEPYFQWKPLHNSVRRTCKSLRPHPFRSSYPLLSLEEEMTRGLFIFFFLLTPRRSHFLFRGPSKSSSYVHKFQTGSTSRWIFFVKSLVLRLTYLLN